jgi:hypothetical protein
MFAGATNPITDQGFGAALRRFGQDQEILF